MPTRRIAYIFTPIEFGGAERVNLTFLRHTDRSRFSVSVIALVRPWETENHLLREVREAGYPVHIVPVAKRPKQEGRDWFRLLRCFRMIHALLRQGSFDLVHSHGYFADLMGIPAAALLGIPRISTCHGFIETGRMLKLYNRLDRRVLRYAHRIVAVSEAIRDELVRSGVEAAHVTTIENAVAAERPETLPEARRIKRAGLALTEQDFVAGYVGRLSEEKGVHNLVRACSLLAKTFPRLRLLVIGDGPERARLERLAREQAGENILFSGFQRDVERWLPALDLFVLPSLTEGTPMALLEAMGCGIPVIASAVGGVPRVVTHGVNGVLVKPDSVEELKAAIEQLLDNDAARAGMAREARLTVERKYGVQDWIRRIQAEYEELIPAQP